MRCVKVWTASCQDIWTPRTFHILLFYSSFWQIDTNWSIWSGKIITKNAFINIQTLNPKLGEPVYAAVIAASWGMSTSFVHWETESFANSLVMQLIISLIE